MLIKEPSKQPQKHLSRAVLHLFKSELKFHLYLLRKFGENGYSYKRSYLDKGIERTLIRFADNSKLRVQLTHLKEGMPSREIWTSSRIRPMQISCSSTRPNTRCCISVRTASGTKAD